MEKILHYKKKPTARATESRKRLYKYYFGMIVGMGFIYWLVGVLFCWVASNGEMYIIKSGWYVFLVFLGFMFLSYNRAKWFYIQGAFLFFFGAIFSLFSIFYYLNDNLPFSWSTIITIAATILLLFYTQTKASFICCAEKNLIKAKKINLYKMVYYINNRNGPSVAITDIDNKKPYKERTVLSEWVDDILSWLIIFAYYFIPPAPLLLRGVDHNRPLYYLMFFLMLFCLWAFGYFTYFFYNMAKFFHNEEKASKKRIELAYKPVDRK